MGSIMVKLSYTLRGGVQVSSELASPFCWQRGGIDEEIKDGCQTKSFDSIMKFPYGKGNFEKIMVQCFSVELYIGYKIGMLTERKLLTFLFTWMVFDLEMDIWIIMHCSLALNWVVNHFQGCFNLATDSLLLVCSLHWSFLHPILVVF